MSRTTSQATTTTPRSNPSRLFASAKGKSTTNVTSDTIAEDIAAFKKQGGRIETLGTTPFRARAQAPAFRSKANTQRKARPATAAAKTPAIKTVAKA